MTTAIIGNLGYVGSVLVPYLTEVSPGTKLIGYDNAYFSDCLFGHEIVPERYLHHQYFGDIRSLDTSVFHGVNSVVHLAAISNDPMGKAFEAPTVEINLDFTIKLASQAKLAGVRHFAFASSCSVYGEADDAARSESSTLNPQTTYARSKIRVEEELHKLADENFIVTSLRFATACGYSPRLRLDLVLNDFVANALVSRKIEILSNGKPWRPLIHVRDMCRAFHWAISRPLEAGGEFVAVNTGSDEWNYQIGELGEAVRNHFENVDLTINKDAAVDNRSYKVDFGLFSRLAPHHQPVVTLTEAIEDLVQGIKRGEFFDTHFRNSKYVRLNRLNDLIALRRLDERLFWSDD